MSSMPGGPEHISENSRVFSTWQLALVVGDVQPGQPGGSLIRLRAAMQRRSVKLIEPRITLVPWVALTKGVTKGLLRSPEEIEERLRTAANSLGTVALEGRATHMGVRQPPGKPAVAWIGFDPKTRATLSTLECKAIQTLGVPWTPSREPCIKVAPATVEEIPSLRQVIRGVLPFSVRITGPELVSSDMTLYGRTEHERAFAEALSDQPPQADSSDPR